MKRLRMSDVSPEESSHDIPPLREPDPPPKKPGFKLKAPVTEASVAAIASPPPDLHAPLRLAVDELRQLRCQIDELRHRYLDDLEALSTRLNDVTLRLEEVAATATVAVPELTPASRDEISPTRRKEPLSLQAKESPSPVPAAVNAIKGWMRDLRDAIQHLTDERTLPPADIPLEQKLVEAIGQVASGYLEEFVLMHGAAREAGLWDAATLEEYESYCGSRYVADMLDPLEQASRDHQPAVREALLDYLAMVVALDMIPVDPGITSFDPEKHEIADGTPAPDEATILAVEQAGYVDARRQHLVRKCRVRIEPTAVAQKPKSSARTGTFVDGREVTATASGNLPVPPEVAHCQQLVFRIKIAVSNLAGSGKLPRSGDAIDPEVITLLRDYGNWLLQRMTALHSLCQANANARYAELRRSDPVRALAEAWSDELIGQYNRFLHQTAVEGFLDRLEVQLRARKLESHLELVDHLAGEMEMARQEIIPRKTLFDPRRHEVSGKVSDEEALPGARITRIIRAAYTDLNSGETVRKALVEVQIPSFDKPLELPVEEPEDAPLDLDVS